MRGLSGLWPTPRFCRAFSPSLESTDRDQKFALNSFRRNNKWQLAYDQLPGINLLPRDTMLAWHMPSSCVCLCVCVCVSVTLRYCIKMAKRRITQTTPHDSPMTLVFWCQISWRNSNGITPYGGDKCRWGGLKLVTFDEKRAITRKRYKIDV